MCYVQNQWYDISCATLYIFTHNNVTGVMEYGLYLRRKITPVFVDG